jgi:hypothetical protein
MPRIDSSPQFKCPRGQNILCLREQSHLDLENCCDVDQTWCGLCLFRTLLSLVTMLV